MTRVSLRFGQVNLKRPCPFWEDDGRCSQTTCRVKCCEEVSAASQSPDPESQSPGRPALIIHCCTEADRESVSENRPSAVQPASSVISRKVMVMMCSLMSSLVRPLCRRPVKTEREGNARRRAVRQLLPQPIPPVSVSIFTKGAKKPVPTTVLKTAALGVAVFHCREKT